MRKLLRVAVSAALAALFLVAASGQYRAWAAEGAAAAGTEVKIDNFSFTPQAITVKAGTTITWTNHDDIPHTVVSDEQLFKSKALDTDDKFSTTLTKPGTYSYFCSIHPKMTGKVVVE
ncbi:MAG: cupredoxin family copper-binding protein [Terriglobales bacterium]